MGDLPVMRAVVTPQSGTRAIRMTAEAMATVAEMAVTSRLTH